MDKELHHQTATIEKIWATLDRISAMYEKAAQEMEESREEEKRSKKQFDKRMKKLEGLFTTQWGALIESLVEGDLVPLLQKRDIAVTHTFAPVKGRHNGEDYEFDILAWNGEEVVVVEVKTTLRPEDVPHFLRKLDRFTVYVPAYRGKKVYGAVAYLKADKSVQAHAQRQGLFVIRATGSSASIINNKGFVPRVF